MCLSCAGEGSAPRAPLAAADGDGDGQAALSYGGADCADDDPERFVGAPEVCDGVDNNCNGLVDDQDPLLERASAQVVFLQDQDRDGSASPQPSWACSPPASLPVPGDCDDLDGSRNPQAHERCDGLDNDCDGLVDEADPEVQGVITLWPDLDLDGWGAGEPLPGCRAAPGLAPVAGDCDDLDGRSAPGRFDACSDGVDQDCDGREPNPWLLDVALLAADVPGSPRQLDLWIRRLTDEVGDGLRWTLLTLGEAELWVSRADGAETLCWKKAPSSSPCCVSAPALFPVEAYQSLSVRLEEDARVWVTVGAQAILSCPYVPGADSWRLGDSAARPGVFGLTQLATWDALQPAGPLPTLFLPGDQAGLWRAEAGPTERWPSLIDGAELTLDPLAWRVAPCP